MNFSGAEACPLWHFSLALYAQQTVAENCLRLQDSYGLDINIVLALLWFSNKQQCLLNEKQLIRLIQISEPWQGYASNVRQLRRRLKQALKTQALTKEEYQQVKLAELHYEFYEQQALNDYLLALLPCTHSETIAPYRVAAHNLAHYYEKVHAEQCEVELQQIIRKLLIALWPDNAHEIDANSQ